MAVIFPAEIVKFSIIDAAIPDAPVDAPVPIPAPYASVSIPLHIAVIFPPEIASLASVEVDLFRKCEYVCPSPIPDPAA
jgi:hypothetical protein